MDQVNPWSRWAGGPCPCRCRRSRRRLPPRGSRLKRRVLFSLEFPFLHATRYTLRASLPVGRPPKPMVHRLRGRWCTSKGTVSLGTQLGGVRSKTSGRGLPLGRREAAYSTKNGAMERRTTGHAGVGAARVGGSGGKGACGQGRDRGDDALF